MEVEEGEGVLFWDRRGGRGRKLQAEAGRAETRVKIWERRDCWVVVSWVGLFSGGDSFRKLDESSESGGKGCDAQVGCRTS